MKVLTQECIRCVMNNTVDREISFNDAGLCSHCLRYDELVSTRTNVGTNSSKQLEDLISKIKKSGLGKDYDCIIGVSGGVDSTYLAYLASKHGLRPLAVHLDNGWNSELSVKNIENTLEKLEIDLVTRVIDWPEFRDLQRSFIKSSTPDGDVPSDHAIFATLWHEAKKHKVKYILFGMNFATESMSVPSWSYGHSDWKYIKAIHSRFGQHSLKTFPKFSLFFLFFVTFVLGIRRVALLNYIEYDRAKAEYLIEKKLGWQAYSGKHHESIYTRFWQGHVLPRKFKIDKRYAHLSDLINSGQMTRSAALKELENPPYSVEVQRQDYSYVIKKLRFSEAEFEEIMEQMPRSYKEFPNSSLAVFFLKRIVDFLRRTGLYPK